MDVEIRPKDADTPEKSMSLFFFFFHSVAVAALFPIVLRRSGRDMLIAVWMISLLLCSYFYSAVCVLSASTRKAKVRLLVRLTCAALLALVVDAVLSHAAGTVIIYLDSVWIAGVFGHALAEHRSSVDAAEKTAPSLGKLAGESGLIIFLALVFSACGLCPMGIIMAAPRGALLLSPPQEDLVAYVTMALFLCLPIVVILVRGQGGIVVVLGVECDPRNVLVGCYTSSFILFTLNFILVSEVTAVVILGLAVFFGYCNGINPCFLVRSKPKMGKLPDDEHKTKQADEGNKEQTEIGSDSTTTAGKQTHERN